jgi:hypothetical protein
VPTTRELVSNKALQGVELAEIIRSDVDRMLHDNGLLAGQTAYSRVAYDLRLTLHLGLPAMPTSEDRATSRTQARDQVELRPDLAALEPFPLSAAPDAILSATELSRDIDSPNVARVLHQLPIEVSVTGNDGRQTERLVEGYTPESAGLTAEQLREPDLSDVSDEMKRELGL